jgi:hypothetical protein
LIVFPDIRDREVNRDLGSFTQKVTSEEVIDRELHLADRNPAAGDRITGVVRERTRGGSKPVAAAVVEPVAHLQTSRAVTDAQGRFKLARADVPLRLMTGRDAKQALYACSRDGSLSAFASITSDQREVAIELGDAGRVTGQVVDDDGKPLAGRSVQLRMSPSAEDRFGLCLTKEAWSDDRGRYTFTGLVAGAYCEIWTFEGVEKPAHDGIFTRDFKVDSSVPISLPSLIVPALSARAADAAAEVHGYRMPVKLAAMARPATIPAGPSRAEIEDLIRAIGRDPATTRLVDRVVARFHPRLWTGDFNYVHRLATEPEFVQRMDGLARTALGKPLDTIMLLRCVTTYEV